MGRSNELGQVQMDGLCGDTTAPELTPDPIAHQPPEFGVHPRDDVARDRAVDEDGADDAVGIADDVPRPVIEMRRAVAGGKAAMAGRGRVRLVLVENLDVGLVDGPQSDHALNMR